MAYLERAVAIADMDEPWEAHPVNHQHDRATVQSPYAVAMVVADNDMPTPSALRSGHIAGFGVRILIADHAASGRTR